MNILLKNNLAAIKRGLHYNSTPPLTTNDIVPVGKYMGETVRILIKINANYLKWAVSKNIINLDRHALKQLNDRICDQSYNNYISCRNRSYKKYDDIYDDHDDCGLTAFDLGADF